MAAPPAPAEVAERAVAGQARMAIVRPEEAREEADAALSAAVGAKDLEGLKAAIEAAEAAGVAKKSLQRARKAAEKLQEEEEKEEEAPANKADDEDALADAIVAAAMLESWPGADETAEADRHAESQEDSGSGQGEPRGSDEEMSRVLRKRLKPVPPQSNNGNNVASKWLLIPRGP